ncbi:ankyrin repeat-containing protein BDA1-like [Telopea speciosissima]|uniref:ankyrin repeat-containing protein BDA1-like n=1 Tax=Telopea speciosissima TaxID=54955 RepID=UPI001CC390C2|nr:ankyrin repeat-containing protein BDA1-like [Telopea speciosissima]
MSCKTITYFMLPLFLEKIQDVVKILIEKKRELVNKIDENGRTPLHYAASKTWGHKIVQQLLRLDTSSAYKQDKHGLSPVHIAALKSSIKVFGELIHWCPDSVKLLDKNRCNVLHFAVMSKDYKKIKFALQQVVLEKLVNQPDDDGNTPFHLVAIQGSLQLMKLFLSNTSVDIKATNKKGQTADAILHLIPRKATICSRMSGWFHFNAVNLLRLFAVRGEEKWIRGEANEEQRQTDPNKQDEVAAIKSKIKKIRKALQVVACLIATIIFAALVLRISINNGKPIYLHKG